MILMQSLRSSVAWMFGLVVSIGVAHADTAQCDRACLIQLSDDLLTSMERQSPASAPLAPVYAATENSVPSAVPMMALWRTVSAAKDRYYVVDPASQQVYLIVTIAEAGNDSLLFGRLKASQRKVSELELYVNRSRGQGGFQFDAGGVAKLPKAWTTSLNSQKKATRAELQRFGDSMFDVRLTAPLAAAECRLLENGQEVQENPEVLAAIMPADAKHGPQLPKNANGTVPVPCGAPPDRPSDPHARTNIIDEEQGVVVSMGTVHGFAAPYVVTSPTESAFVPASMLSPYNAFMQSKIKAGNLKNPYIKDMKASGTAIYVVRIFDGQMQGLHLMVNLGAPGAVSPWN